VRTAAEVHPVALPVERDRIFRNVSQNLDFVVLAHPPEQLDGVLLGHFASMDREVLAGQLLHFLFNAFELIGSERSVALEVVVESLLGRRADRDLGFREQVLDRLGHQVSRGVA